MRSHTRGPLSCAATSPLAWVVDDDDRRLRIRVTRCDADRGTVELPGRLIRPQRVVIGDAWGDGGCQPRGLQGVTLRGLHKSPPDPLPRGTS